tara:strand:- start:3422 stop:4333 length:912 start_codon:yes stop_codon:yes gene_type:complete
MNIIREAARASNESIVDWLIDLVHDKVLKTYDDIEGVNATHIKILKFIKKLDNKKFREKVKEKQFIFPKDRAALLSVDGKITNDFDKLKRGYMDYIAFCEEWIKIKQNWLDVIESTKLIENILHPDRGDLEGVHRWLKENIEDKFNKYYPSLIQPVFKGRVGGIVVTNGLYSPELQIDSRVRDYDEDIVLGGGDILSLLTFCEELLLKVNELDKNENYWPHFEVFDESNSDEDLYQEAIDEPVKFKAANKLNTNIFELFDFHFYLNELGCSIYLPDHGDVVIENPIDHLINTVVTLVIDGVKL